MQIEQRYNVIDMLPTPIARIIWFAALFLILPLAKSIELGPTRMSESRQGSLLAPNKETSRQNITATVIATKQLDISSSPSADPLSQLLQGLRIKDDSNLSTTFAFESDTDPVGGQINIREMLDKLQRMFSTLPRGLLPGRFRTILSPKLLILDLNGLLVDRIKVRTRRLH